MATLDPRSSERATTWREFATAFALVIALHAALGVWLFSAHTRPAPPPVEQPRIIVAELLKIVPVAPVASSAPAAVQHPAPVRPVPPQRVEQPAPPKPRIKPVTPPLPVHREMTAPSPTPTPAPVTAPAQPASQAAEATHAAAPASATAQPAAQPSAANAPPRDVSHVDCSIAQPDYPQAAQRRGESGTAVVRFVVGVDGRVESAQIQKSSGYPRLDEAALAAVQGGSCRPWREGGVPVRVAYAQPFVFGLGN